MTDRAQAFLRWMANLPPDAIGSVVAWAERNVKLVGSVMSQAYNPDLTPWTRVVIECINDGVTFRVTFVKPIQSGGSVVGRIWIMWWIATKPAGDVQFNWPNDDKAGEKWVKEGEKEFLACRAIMDRALGKLTWKDGMVIFPHLNFTIQGVLAAANVTSDSIALQVNEELHDESGWKPGRLEQAHGRLTAVWNGFAGQISNAGKKGGELHQSFQSGTMEPWMDKCPGCDGWHVMRTRWDPGKPELGGLRYDSDGCKLPGGGYDYNRLEPTIYYQMPCGFRVKDDAKVRRRMSTHGKYGPPMNPGANRSHRSFTLQGVSVYYIPWLTLIQQKHKALRSLARGDPEPWNTYLRERECEFSSDETRPIVQKLELSTRKKDRDGLPNRVARFGAADYQQGKGGEGAHWWCLIIDVEVMTDGMIHLLIVFEGKLWTDMDLVKTFERHTVSPVGVVLDASWNPDSVYALAFQNGYNALKGAGGDLFNHPDGSRKIFSVETPLHKMMGERPPKHSYVMRHNPETKQVEQVPDDAEPQFWRYNKAGIMDRALWFRTAKECWLEVPSDVSEEFKEAFDSWSCEIKVVAGTNEKVPQWRQLRDNDHLWQCLAYSVMLCEKYGIIGSGELQETPKVETK